MPSALPRLSPAASAIRFAAIAANGGVHTLATLPRKIRDQRDTESCVSCALAGAMESRHQSWPELAPLFHYHVTRFVNHGGDSQGRLFLDRGLETLTVQGICREADHASVFTAPGIATPPASAAFADAIDRRIPRVGLFFCYEELAATSRVAEVRRHLRANNPVVIVFTLPMGYPDAFLNSEGAWLDPNGLPPSASKHCVLVVAFDDLYDRRGAVRIVDSKGKTRFDRGAWLMGYDVLDSGLVHQAFALT